MNKQEAKEINKRLADFEYDLFCLRNNGILTDKQMFYLVQIAGPFLETLTDIAQSLESISKGASK